MNAFLDAFFIIFHSVLIIFNLSGWIWKKTRKLNLLVLGLTAFSWFGLGIFYGFGYCACTDWHWQVRYNMGLYDMPNSYVKFLLDKFTGLDWNTQLVDTATLLLFIAAVLVSLYVNIKDRKRRKANAAAPDA
jgi:hypothetical protein